MENVSAFPSAVAQPEAIVAAIRTKGITLRELARRYDLPDDAVSSALRKPYHAAEAAIADFLDISPRALWPERYNANGDRKQPQPSANYRPKRRFARVSR